jgi:predicted RNase H-like nuclease
VRAYVGATIGALLQQADADPRAPGPVVVVGVDMPIGLPDDGARQADRQAAADLGARRSSVFLTPVRAALEAATHAEAVIVNRAATGAGVSIQAYGLRHKILEVDGWLRSGTYAGTVLEVHPELSFAALAGRTLATRKLTWAGAYERRRLLAAAGIDLDDDFGPAGAAAGVDDLLDAAAAAWSAARYARGDAVSRPDPPERFGDGLATAIWT